MEEYKELLYELETPRWLTNLETLEAAWKRTMTHGRTAAIAIRTQQGIIDQLNKDKRNLANEILSLKKYALRP